MDNLLESMLAELLGEGDKTNLLAGTKISSEILEDGVQSKLAVEGTRYGLMILSASIAESVSRDMDPMMLALFKMILESALMGEFHVTSVVVDGEQNEK